MVTCRLRHLTNSIYVIQRFGVVLELEFPAQVVFIHHLPSIQLSMKRLDRFAS
jgi:hypothetical protein